MFIGLKKSVGDLKKDQRNRWGDLKIWEIGVGIYRHTRKARKDVSWHTDKICIDDTLVCIQSSADGRLIMIRKSSRLIRPTEITDLNHCQRNHPLVIKKQTSYHMSYKESKNLKTISSILFISHHAASYHDHSALLHPMYLLTSCKESRRSSVSIGATASSWPSLCGWLFVIWR